MKPTYDEFQNELANELAADPALAQLSRLLYAQDRAFERHVNEQLAVCERVGKQLDKVPRMLVQLVTEGETNG